MMFSNFKHRPPIVFAPMAGVSDSPTRRIAKELGADMVVSEMISAEGLIRNSRPTLRLARFQESERPIGLQIFGARPESMAEAAKILATLEPNFIDINFGCPVHKIVAKNGGSSLLKDLHVMSRIVESIVTAIQIPVTLKIRSGWDNDSLVHIEIGKMAESLGVAAICIHPRTRAAGFSGEADWSHIKLLKEAVQIPVIGNGDINSPQKAGQMISETGCDAIMIGRAAMGNPWIFQRTARLLDSSLLIPEPSIDERIEVALRHFQYMSAFYGLQPAIYKMRSQFCWYFKGLPDSSTVKTKIVRAKSESDIRDILFGYANFIKQSVPVLAPA